MVINGVSGIVMGVIKCPEGYHVGFDVYGVCCLGLIVYWIKTRMQYKLETLYLVL